jgi:hypothetical protein
VTDTERQLHAELAALRTLVESLQAQLETARTHKAPTMRARTRCPACSATRIAHAAHVLDRGDGDARKPMAISQPSWWSDKLVGELETFVCTSCGLVEWYAKDPGGLREVKGQVTILDGNAPETGPYR